MSLKYELTKGHLTASRAKIKLRRSDKYAPGGVLEQNVFQQACWKKKIGDILLFLDFKCIKREPACIDAVNQYCWRGDKMLLFQLF